MVGKPSCGPLSAKDAYFDWKSCRDWVLRSGLPFRWHLADRLFQIKQNRPCFSRWVICATNWLRCSCRERKIRHVQQELWAQWMLTVSSCVQGNRERKLSDEQNANGLRESEQGEGRIWLVKAHEEDKAARGDRADADLFLAHESGTRGLGINPAGWLTTICTFIIAAPNPPSVLTSRALIISWFLLLPLQLDQIPRWGWKYKESQGCFLFRSHIHLWRIALFAGVLPEMMLWTVQMAVLVSCRIWTACSHSVQAHQCSDFQSCWNQEHECTSLLCRSLDKQHLNWPLSRCRMKYRNWEISE